MEKLIKIGTCGSCKMEGTIYLDTGLCMCCDKRGRKLQKSEYEKALEIVDICAMNSINVLEYSGKLKLTNDECMSLWFESEFTFDEIKTAFWDNKL